MARIVMAGIVMVPNDKGFPDIHRWFPHVPYSDGLHSYGLYTYGLYTYGPYSYGRYSYDLYRHGLYSHGLYIVMAFVTPIACTRSRQTPRPR